MQLIVNSVAYGVLHAMQPKRTIVPMKLGAAVRAIRKEAGLTTDMLADRAGTTKSSVSRIENDEQVPSLDMLERLAAALDLKLYQLIARAESVSLPVAKAAPMEKELLKELRAMRPEVREHYVALARDLTKRK